MMFKYLLVIAVVLVAFWLWRNDRRQEQAGPASGRPPSPPPAPIPMVACRHCGTHLPETEAVRGTHGWYCCASHRRLEDPPT